MTKSRTPPEPPRTLRVKHLSIRNILGIRDLDLSPGAVTIATGRNGAGKTTLLRALDIAFRGAGDGRFRTPVHLDSEDGSGEVEVELDDLEITRAFHRTEEGETREKLTVKRDGEELAKPATLLSRLLGPISFNPISFASAPARERRALLLEAMRLSIAPGDVRGSLPPGISLPETIDWSLPALDVLEALRAHYYSLRAGENVAQVRLRKTVEQLSQRIPEGHQPIDPQARAEIMRELGDAERIASARERLAADLSEAERSLARQVEHERSQSERLTSLQAEIDAAPEVSTEPLVAEVADLEAKLAAARARLAAAREQNNRRAKAKAEEDLVSRQHANVVAGIANLRPLIEEKRAALHARPAPALDAIRSRLSALDTTAEIDALYRERAARQVELAEVSATWETLEKAVIACGVDLPRALIGRSSLPVDGLTIEADEVRLRGKAFSGMSGRERMLLSLEIARALMRDQPLKLLCLDGGETLDDDAFRGMVDALNDGTFQIFVTRVSPGDLRIETLDAPAAPAEVAG